jgi:hypothetical protein
VTAVQVAVLVFAAPFVVFATIWARWYVALRSREDVDRVERLYVGSRAVCYAGIGVFVALAAVLRSQWCGWIAISFMAILVVMTRSLARRERRRAQRLPTP